MKKTDGWGENLQAWGRRKFWGKQKKKP